MSVLRVPKTAAEKQYEACPLGEHHNDGPGRYSRWGYPGPTSFFRRRHVQCRCKGCGLYVIWIRRGETG